MGMSKDWIDDPAISPEEKLQRFQALSPEPTGGPISQSFGSFVASSPSNPFARATRRISTLARTA